MNSKRTNSLVLAVGLVFSTGTALAVGTHDEDVLPLLEGGTIVLDDLDDKEFDFASGYPIFEADFGDLGGGPDVTDDPGFDHEAGQFTPGTLLAIKVLSPLEFWNGSSWSNLTPASFTIVDAIGNEVVVTSSSSSIGGFGLIGQVDGDGNLHEHIDFKISSDAAIGAYAVTFGLFGLLADQTTPVYGESNPFMFIFNRGLSGEAFEAAVGARVVPIPAAVWLFGSALAGLGVLRRTVTARHS
jgi:hypothetical protein